MFLTVHELAYRGKIGLGIYAHHRDLFIVGQEQLFLGSKNIVELGDMFGGSDQNQIGIDLFTKGKQILLVSSGTRF